MKCPSCDGKFDKRKLKWMPRTDADEAGVYVVYLGLCPFCHGEIVEKFGYETTPDEPLRYET